MRVDSFVAAYTGGSTLVKNSGQRINDYNYFRESDIHNNIQSSEKYKANFNIDIYKERALKLAMAPLFYNLTKDADGTYSYDSKQLSQEEVLAIRSEDLKNIEINLASLKIQLANRMPINKNLDHVGYDIDYFASEYVQYKNRIMENFSGEKQIEELEKLDNLVKTNVEKYANQFADMTGGFLSQYGVSGEKEAIKESVIELFEQRTAKYTDFIQKHDNYAGVKGTEDEWLLIDNLFMGEQLRYAFSMEQNGWDPTESGYSIDDLTAVGTLVKEMRYVGYQSYRMRFNNSHKSEEEYGVELGLTAMKYELISKTYDINNEVKSKLNMAFQNFISVQNDQASDYIIKMRNDPLVREEHSYAIDWNPKLVLDIIHRMVANMKSSDLNAAFKEDISIIMELYKNKTKNSQTKQLGRYQPFHNSWLKSQYVGDWNQFVQRLSLTSGQKHNQYILQDFISILDIRI